ncbi:PilW family protein [Hydrogenophaga sp. SL48]|uniref:PilW family protein n=1 Tax=Hydrogenophaga sp. SL48 TaxID=2806347 RepID=UPI001F022A1A|nr:PilW family protein [Hydrogenophaga sp. SL48]UJW83585.1 PilW family protein [Hydrogenophaga sp. SL48]
MTKLSTSRRPGARAQRGLSLVELMVAMTIGLFLMGAVGVIYVNTSTTSRSSTLESQMNEDAALALELLQQQIRLTGFSNVDNSGARLFPGRAVRGCDGGFTDNAAGTAFEALACDATGSGPDAIAVRYEASLLNSQFVTDATGVRSPGNCAHEGITAWDASAEGAASATPLSLADNRYYIANDADGTPSLFCQGRTGSGFGNATALIPNIEDLQVQYAVTAAPTAGNPLPHQVAGYVGADHAVLGATATNWSRVAALRICILARTARPAPTGDNSINDLGSYIDCDGTEQTATDRFLRRAYVTTIQLRNMRPGLPSDYVSGEDPWAFLYEN